MLNPSTADASKDDATIRRCVGFTRSWEQVCRGYGGIVVVNLYGLRATNPAELRKHRDPVGDQNRDHVRKMATECRLVVAAWGNHGAERGPMVRLSLERAGVRLHHLGSLTTTGQPRHPLHLRKDTPLIEWPPNIWKRPP